ncbi:aminoglycoside phosphotransferase [gamma proteobacterium HTCC5015]|nr:aminoglycoside phosphotransferase [gamma proteobacterium HTCC5015]
MSDTQQPFHQLTPSIVADAVESVGFLCDGRTFPLNSYENRVYQVGIEDEPPLIAKFYRPQRWSDEQILEEHNFAQTLSDEGVSAVPAIQRDGESLLRYGEYRFALFKRQGGHAPEPSLLDQTEILGRSLGRIHRIGSQQDFLHRPRLDPTSYGHRCADFLKNWGLPLELESIYTDLLDEALAKIDRIYAETNDITYIRCHGDCHIGNILWRDNAPHFVDFDDARMAPAIQDLWMMFSGDDREQRLQLDALLEGYEVFHHLPTQQLHLIEALRTLRVIHHSAWLAQRWQDPAFPHAFPWFNTQRYWEEQVLTLREQLAALDAPALHPITL